MLPAFFSNTYNVSSAKGEFNFTPSVENHLMRIAATFLNQWNVLPKQNSADYYELFALEIIC